MSDRSDEAEQPWRAPSRSQKENHGKFSLLHFSQHATDQVLQSILRTLFVALLRAAGVPAKLLFVSLSSKFLAGIIDVPQQSITHAVGEVYLSGRWVQTDTYVTDEQFEMRAWGELVDRGLRVGLGIHVSADRFWSGQKDSHAQYSDKDPSSLPIEDLGVAHDPKYFYSDRSKQDRQLSWTTRLKWLLVATVVNHRVGKIRLGNFDC